MKNVTAIVISFLRPGYTLACVQSLRQTYPDINIIVGENGHHDAKLAIMLEKNGARYVQLPYDSGVCVARNELVKLVDTEYVLVGDDDFFYTADAGVERMKQFLEFHPEFDLIGGRVIENDIVRNYQGFISRYRDHIELTPISLEKQEYGIDEQTGMRYCKADLTFNFFVGRAERVRAVRWDEEIKVAYEHLSWFIDFKEAGGHVAFTPDAIVIHKPEHVDPQQSADYPAFRYRRNDKERFFKRFGINYTITMNGTRDLKPDHILERRKNDTKFVDFCITTFKRPKALERLLLSIAKFYPMANVYIADQNEKLDRVLYKDLRTRLLSAGLLKRVSIEHLPYDCGLSYARNHLVNTTPNKYKLILDDDMEFVRETDIGKMVQLMDSDRSVGVVGGLLKQNGSEVHFEFTPEVVGDTIVHKHDTYNWRNYNGIRYRRSGCVLNFALMRKDIFQQIQWDENLKVTEHLDFYLRFKNLPYVILYTPDVWIDHPPTAREPDYKELRQRPEFQAMMLRKHKARRVKYQNGQVVELMPDGSLSRYKEQPV